MEEDRFEQLRASLSELRPPTKGWAKAGEKAWSSLKVLCHIDDMADMFSHIIETEDPELKEMMWDYALEHMRGENFILPRVTYTSDNMPLELYLQWAEVQNRRFVLQSQSIFYPATGYIRVRKRKGGIMLFSYRFDSRRPWTQIDLRKVISVSPESFFHRGGWVRDEDQASKDDSRQHPSDWLLYFNPIERPRQEEEAAAEEDYYDDIPTYTAYVPGEPIYDFD